MSTSLPVFDPREFNKKFDSEAYLRDFYSSTEAEPAMKVVLYFLPNVVARIPQGVTVLDIGSGPTIHVPMCFRNVAKEVWLSDFARTNRNTLKAWREGKNTFDWSAVAKFISQMEGNEDRWETFETKAREKVSGILECDVLKRKVLRHREQFEPFDVITTIFCLEAASSTEEEYRKGFRNICRLLKTGGLLIMGGILEESIYQFGGKAVKCYFLTEEVVMSCVKKNGINLEPGQFLKIDHKSNVS